MRLAQAVRLGAWVLVGLNLLMALGTIGILMRMSPAIAAIITRNEHSLQDCEEMLAALALAGEDLALNEKQQARFKVALNLAKKNVTEEGELAVVQKISTRSSAAFAGEDGERDAIIADIVRLAEINREAILQAEKRARQLSEAGVWGVVFMALCVFGVGLLFVRSLLRRVVKPIEEINTVIVAYRNGEIMRRCTMANMPQDVRAVFSGINEILDRGQAHILSQKMFAEESRTESVGH
jgi:hypothetical protein